MSKLKKDSNGFSAVELIMALVIIALIGAVGWLVYKNHHNDTSTTTSSAIPAIPVKPNESVASPYAGWNTYTLPKEKLTFRYPTTWTVADTSYTDSNNDGIELTSKTDSSFEILIGAGQDVAAVDNYDSSCVQQADIVEFANQTGYLDLVGFANNSATTPSCTPASSTIQRILLSQSNTSASVSNFFLTKNIPQPAAPAASEIVVSIDYNRTNASTAENKTLSEIENDADYKDAKLVVESMSY